MEGEQGLDGQEPEACRRTLLHLPSSPCRCELVYFGVWWDESELFR